MVCHILGVFNELLVLAACTTKNNVRSNAAYIIKAKTFNTNCLIHYTSK
jgi:hypothetical protein